MALTTKGQRRQQALSYVVAATATTVAVMLRLLFDPWIGDNVPFATLYGAVALAAWHGGVGPAIFAMALGYLATNYLFIEPRGSLTIASLGDHLSLVLYLSTSSIIAGLTEAMRRSQRRTREGRELFKVTLASIGDGVITTDADGLISSLNNVAQTLTGWTEVEALGQPLDVVFRILNELTRKPVENPATRALRDGVVVGLANHTVLIRKDGTELAIDDSAAPIRDKEDCILGCVLVFRDVAERECAEELVRSVVNNVIDGIITIDERGVVQSFNPAAERLFGYPATEVIGQNVKTLMPAPYHSEHDGYLANYLRTGEAKIIGIGREVMGRRKDGSTFPMELAVSELWVGNRRHFTGIVRDVTERKKAEEQLRRAVAFNDAVMNNMGEGLYTVDSKGQVTYMNPAAEASFGFAFEELKGRKMHDMTHHSHPDGTPLPIEECAGFQVRTQGKVFKDYDDWFIRKDGSFFPVTCSSSPLPMGENVAGMVAVFRDVTERKQAEDIVREADRRKDEFLAMLAHELRGPLAPLRNTLEIIKRADNDAILLEESRQTMERQLGQLVRLVDDLIDVSRISRGTIELRKTAVELESIVRQAVEASRPLAECSNHKMTVALPELPIYLDGDPVRLVQIFSNLLSNACKYTEPGGQINLTAERQGSDVVVKIMDTGVGIPSDKLERIFEMFTQVDQSLERRQGGLGIGLTLVKRLVEMHDGSVEAFSEGPGRGSEFVVRLPIRVGKLGVAPVELPPESPEIAGRRILVVDDNADSAESLARLFAMAGNKTHTAHDGLEAVDAAQKFCPDIILLDIGLPKINGYDACRKIRAESAARNAVIIALTGWGQEDDRTKSKEAGFDAHIVKPVDYGGLMKLLNDLINAPRSAVISD